MFCKCTFKLAVIICLAICVLSERSYAQTDREKILKLAEENQVLAIGETHYNRYINEKIIEIITDIAEKYQDTKIILTTEFIYQSEQSILDEIMSKESVSREDLNKLPIASLKAGFRELRNMINTVRALNLSRSDKNKIEIVGLELDQKQSVEKRNNDWVKVIKRKIKENPAAKILTWCGADHSRTDELYSIGSLLNKTNISVGTIEVYDTKKPRSDERNYPCPADLAILINERERQLSETVYLNTPLIYKKDVSGLSFVTKNSEGYSFVLSDYNIKESINTKNGVKILEKIYMVYDKPYGQINIYGVAGSTETFFGSLKITSKFAEDSSFFRISKKFYNTTLPEIIVKIFLDQKNIPFSRIKEITVWRDLYDEIQFTSGLADDESIVEEKLFTSDELISNLKKSGQKIVTFVGYNDNYCESEDKIKKVIEDILEHLNPKTTIIQVRGKLFTMGAVTYTAHSAGFKVIGIESVIFKRYMTPMLQQNSFDLLSMLSNTESYYLAYPKADGFMDDKKTKLSPVSETIVETSDVIIGVGGDNEVADILEAGYNKGKAVYFLPADIRHKNAIKKAQQMGDPIPTDFSGEAYKRMLEIDKTKILSPDDIATFAPFGSTTKAVNFSSGSTDDPKGPPDDGTAASELLTWSENDVINAIRLLKQTAVYLLPETFIKQLIDQHLLAAIIKKDKDKGALAAYSLIVSLNKNDKLDMTKAERNGLKVKLQLIVANTKLNVDEVAVPESVLYPFEDLWFADGVGRFMSEIKGKDITEVDEFIKTFFKGNWKVALKMMVENVKQSDNDPKLKAKMLERMIALSVVLTYYITDREEFIKKIAPNEDIRTLSWDVLRFGGDIVKSSIKFEQSKSGIKEDFKLERSMGETDEIARDIRGRYRGF